MRFPGSVKVILYAAFVGLLLASYVSPLQDILDNRARVAQLSGDLEEAEKANTARERNTKELQTPEGVERTARGMGMVKPGEKVYIVEKE